MKYLCPVHGEKKISYGHLAEGRGCKQCATDNHRLSYDIVKKSFENRGYTLLEMKYINSTTRMRFNCLIHGEQTITYNSLRCGGGCMDCGIESRSNKHKLSIEFVKQEYKNRRYTLLEDYYINSTTPMKYLCNIHGEQIGTYNNLRSGSGCLLCGTLMVKKKNSGENCWNWKGGISGLNVYLRDTLTQWKIDSVELCDYKCVLSGSNKFQVHHIKSFNTIVNDTLNFLNYPILPTRGDYTEDQLNVISSTFIEMHYDLMGVCLDIHLHELFHLMYGHGDNTVEQWKEFKRKYYDDQLTYG
jgi:hypothetical protein